MADSMRTLTLESLAKKYERDARALGYAQDPVAWMEDILEAFLWSAQKEVVASVVANRYTAVQAGHGVGKSYLAAALTAWWLLNHRRGYTRVVTTAPTAAQVEHVIWMEIKRVHRVLEQKGLHEGSKITAGNQPQWKTQGGQDTIAIGRKPADHDDNGFQGFHDDYLMVIVDEACGIPKNLWDGVDSVATGADNRIVAFGNPTDPQSHFRKICKEMPDWNVIRIDLLRSPNMTQAAMDEFPDLAAAMREAGIRPSMEVVPPHVAKSISSAAFVAEKARMWGTKSSLWMAKIRGDFPNDSTEGVIPLAWIEQAQQRWVEWDDAGRPPLSGIPVISADVSGGGEDATCIGYRVGPCLVNYKSFQGEDDPLAIYRRMIVAQGPRTLDIPGLEFIVDSIGEGAGTYALLVDHMVDLKLPMVPGVYGFVASKSATGKNGKAFTSEDGLFGFRNMRDYAWWRMRERLNPNQRGGSPIMLPPDPELTADLQTPKFKVLDTGKPPKIKVELKAEIRERLGHSPDAGDMCVMAFLLNAEPKPDPAHDRAHEWGERQQQPGYSWQSVLPEPTDGFSSQGGFGNDVEGFA